MKATNSLASPGWREHHRQQRVNALKREIKKLRGANEILKLGSAFFGDAQLDRRFE